MSVAARPHRRAPPCIVPGIALEGVAEELESGPDVQVVELDVPAADLDDEPLAVPETLPGLPFPKPPGHQAGEGLDGPETGTVRVGRIKDRTVNGTFAAV